MAAHRSRLLRGEIVNKLPGCKVFVIEQHKTGKQACIREHDFSEGVAKLLVCLSFIVKVGDLNLARGVAATKL